MMRFEAYCQPLLNDSAPRPELPKGGDSHRGEYRCVLSAYVKDLLLDDVQQREVGLTLLASGLVDGCGRLISNLFDCRGQALPGTLRLCRDVGLRKGVRNGAIHQ